MKKLWFVFVALICLGSSQAFAASELQLPFKSGVTLNVTRAYNTPKTQILTLIIITTGPYLAKLLTIIIKLL